MATWPLSSAQLPQAMTLLRHWMQFKPAHAQAKSSLLSDDFERFST
jgi:hypothetical protein